MLPACTREPHADKVPCAGPCTVHLLPAHPVLCPAAITITTAGWLNLLGQIAAVSAVAFLCSGLISTMAAMASTINGGEHITFTSAQVRVACWCC